MVDKELQLYADKIVALPWSCDYYRRLRSNSENTFGEALTRVHEWEKIFAFTFALIEKSMQFHMRYRGRVAFCKQEIGLLKFRKRNFARNMIKRID